MKLRIATRKSQLALTQTNLVIKALKKHNENCETEIIEIISEGDQKQDQSLAEIGGKGLFIKALEEALLADKADMAIHSLKDVPPELDCDFSLAAMLPRESMHDAFLSIHYPSLLDLPFAAKVGTSSVRRKAALLRMRPDLHILPLRGNIDTRLTKLKKGHFDAIILAEAGLKRLHLTDHITEILPLAACPPSVGQGIIAIETLASNHALHTLLQSINDEKTFALATAERALTRTLGASCLSPVSSFATCAQDVLNISGIVFSADGKERIEAMQAGKMCDAEKIGEKAAESLLQQGARLLLI